ncbi:MAG: lysophospholipid acyltransferase family protein [Kiritimatiellia bacterium]|nr:lysophospholipid acyltransferase family protein [Kiritimatiellia bacterium]MDP6847300.1 lysophospholipid acyltransferase family protein [Kiritimatiellia bacterium]
MLTKLFVLIRWYPLRFLVRILPRRLTYLMALAGGRLLNAASRRKSEILSGEFRRSFPDLTEKEVAALVRESFENFCVSEINVMLYPIMDEEFVRRTITIRGEGYLRDALKKGNGVLLFQAHFGAFQMMLPAIGYSGFTINQVAAPATVWKDRAASSVQKKAFDIKSEHERSLPVQFVSIESSMRPVFEALKRKELVGITVDGPAGTKTFKTQFLGRTASFQTGAARLAFKTGAEVVPAFVITRKGLAHEIVIHPPIGTDRSLAEEEFVRETMTQFIAHLNDHAREHPDHFGYSLMMRREHAVHDPYPFFDDYEC